MRARFFHGRSKKPQATAKCRTSRVCCPGAVACKILYSMVQDVRIRLLCSGQSVCVCARPSAQLTVLRRKAMF